MEWLRSADTSSEIDLTFVLIISLSPTLQPIYLFLLLLVILSSSFSVLDSGDSTLTDSLIKNRNHHQQHSLQNVLTQARAHGLAKKRTHQVDNLLNSGSNPPPLTQKDTNMGGNTTRHTAKMINVEKDKYKKLQEDCKKYKHQAKSVTQIEQARDDALQQALDGEKRIQELLAENDELKKKLQRLAKGKSAKNAAKILQATDVLQKIEVFARGLLFRTVKFAQTAKALTRATEMTWNGIKDELKLESPPKKLDFKKFDEIYSCAVTKCISKERQCLQSRGQGAAAGANLPYFCFVFCSFFTLNYIFLPFWA